MWKQLQNMLNHYKYFGPAGVTFSLSDLFLIVALIFDPPCISTACTRTNNSKNPNYSYLVANGTERGAHVRWVDGRAPKRGIHHVPDGHKRLRVAGCGSQVSGRGECQGQGHGRGQRHRQLQGQVRGQSQYHFQVQGHGQG